LVELGRDDAELFDTLCAQYMRKMEDLTLSHFLFFAVSMMKSRTVYNPPKAFFDVFEKKTREQITELKPFEIAFSLALLARYDLGVSSLTDVLIRALETNIHSFSAQHLATGISALIMLEREPSAYLEGSFKNLKLSGPYQAQCLLALYASLRHQRLEDHDVKHHIRAELLRILRQGPDDAPHINASSNPHSASSSSSGLVQRQRMLSSPKNVFGGSSSGLGNASYAEFQQVQQKEGEEYGGEHDEPHYKSRGSSSSGRNLNANKERGGRHWQKKELYMEPEQLEALRELEGADPLSFSPRSSNSGVSLKPLLRSKSDGQKWFARVFSNQNHPAQVRILRRLISLEKASREDDEAKNKNEDEEKEECSNKEDFSSSFSREGKRRHGGTASQPKRTPLRKHGSFTTKAGRKMIQKCAPINLKEEFPFYWRQRRRSQLHKLAQNVDVVSDDGTIHAYRIGTGEFMDHSNAYRIGMTLRIQDAACLGRWIAEEDEEVCSAVASFCIDQHKRGFGPHSGPRH